MNLDQLLATIGATVGIAVALATIGLSRAPGCRELRWLGVITGAAGVACAMRPLAEGLDGDTVARVFARIGMGAGGILSYGWLRYEAAEARRPASRLDRAMGATLLAFAAVALVPSAVLGQQVVRHTDGWSGARYIDVAPTLTGAVALTILFAVPGLVLLRYAKRARRGERGAAAHAVALVGLMLSGMTDVVDGTWVHAWPHLMPLGLLWTIVTVSVVLVGRFVAGARSLADLSGRLNETIAERTVELASTRATLAETEQLATLGRLSAAVAHEINNPAAVVAANLSYLRDTMGADGARLDAARLNEETAAIGDTLESIDRIVRIVRQLGEAGEHAVHGGTTAPVALADLARLAVGNLDAALRDRVSVDVPEWLHAASQEASIRQVLASLVASAHEAVRANDGDGRIVIRGERHGDRALLRIEDPAPEADDVLRARRFAPFTDPRPTVVRGDVGLTVSVALLRMFGGYIRVERADDSGSVVCIDLRAAEAPAQPAEEPVSSTGQRARVLVVDDDVLTRIGFRRLLGREYAVEEAGGVAEALDRVRDHGEDIDVIVCDVVMPDGGAERLLAELGRVAPQLARAMVLLTGGAVDAPTEALLREHAELALRKPVDVATLRALVEKVRRRRRQPVSAWKS
jgi:signal transduction histidine kinase/ActR/RegA family two-component response regulator